MGEQVVWKGLWSIELDTFIGIEAPSEIITVNDSENSLVDIEVLRQVQILPVVILGLIIWKWKLVSLQEDTLGHTGVLNSWFDNVNGVIIKIIVDDALSHSIILIWILNHWFLEICMEFENLSVMFQPFGSNLWDGIVFLFFSDWYTF